MKIKTRYNSEEFPKNYERNTQPSKTIPDQSMSVKEIMERHARGLPTAGERVPVYFGEDEDMPDLKKMDLAEIQELKENAALQVTQLQDKLQEQKTKSSAANRKPTAKLQQLGIDLEDDADKQYPKKTPAEQPGRQAKKRPPEED